MLSDLAFFLAGAGHEVRVVTSCQRWDDAADKPLRRAWGLEDCFVVCYSGNMGRAHGFVTILDAAERLRNRGLSVPDFPSLNLQKCWRSASCLALRAIHLSPARPAGRSFSAPEVPWRVARGR